VLAVENLNAGENAREAWIGGVPDRVRDNIGGMYQSLSCGSGSESATRERACSNLARLARPARWAR